MINQLALLTPLPKVITCHDRFRDNCGIRGAQGWLVIRAGAPVILSSPRAMKLRAGLRPGNGNKNYPCHENPLCIQPHNSLKGVCYDRKDPRMASA